MVELPAGKDATKFIEPCEQALYLPSALVSPQSSPILSRWSNPTAAMRRNHFNAVGCQLFIERITVVGTIPDKSLGESNGDSCIDGSFDKGDFMWASRIRVHGEWKTCSVRNSHELRTFAALGLSHFTPPFFATTKVPSMKHSERSISPLASRSCANASSILRKVPSLTQRLKRRKHVEYEGYLSGRSAQQAPVRSTHSTPSITLRSSCSTGLPRPSERHSTGGINGAKMLHCSSVRNCRVAISASAWPESGEDHYL
jgi:hypothetical protein